MVVAGGRMEALEQEREAEGSGRRREGEEMVVGREWVED